MTGKATMEARRVEEDTRGAGHHQGSSGECQTQVGYRLVPPCAAEARHDQGRDPAEGRERSHLEVADDLIGNGEETGDDESRSQRPHGRVR